MRKKSSEGKTPHRKLTKLLIRNSKNSPPKKQVKQLPKRLSDIQDLNPEEFLRDLRYTLYESAVQAPDQHHAIFSLMFAELRGRKAEHFREDFCGTFKISAHWIQVDSKKTAVGIDLDPDPIDRGMTTHYTHLTSAQKERLTILNQNVLKPIPSKFKFDIASVCNFSFYVLKEREQLKKYFKNVLQSLGKDGIFILEMAGGPGMIEETRETSSGFSKKYGKFIYFWDQKSFDPISHDALYGIHFKLKEKVRGVQKLKDAFVYDWRLWTMPEVKEILLECGYRDVVFYTETSKRGRGSGEYQRSTKAENDYAWISYVVGIK